MNKLLKIFCFCGLFCLWNCCKNSIHPNLINKKVCKQILVKNYFDDNEYIINNNVSIQELYELLQNATLCDIIKLPPRLVLTIKGTNYHQTFFICDDYIKDDKRKIYRSLIPQHYNLTLFISSWATKSCPGFCHVRIFTYLSVAKRKQAKL